ncbi:MAG TPA: CGNR zinc finger domain-containing protein [Acidimicrobiales bacterium]
MHLDHDSELALHEAVALVNADDDRTGGDVLASVGALGAFLDAAGISGTRAGTEAELRAVRRLRTRLRGVFDAAAAGRLDAVVADLNRLIADAGATPQLVEHDGNPLHLHYTRPDAPLQHRLGAEMAIALAVVLRDGGLERLRVCESPDCRRAFVDLSRNRSRRYCDAQCANRQHVAAYRQRRAQADRA